MRWLAVALVLAGCGVPTPPSVPELQARAAQGEGGAAEALLELLGREAPAESRAEAYRALLEVGGGHGALVVGACRDRDPVRREHALALAANLRVPGASEEALRALGDASFPRRYVAAWALGELGEPSAAAPLVGALGGTDRETAKEAVRSLVKLGRQAVPALTEALGRLEGEGRVFALRALGELQDPGARELLVAALDDPETRAQGAWALGKLGDPGAVPALLPLLEDPDWRVRLEATRALGLLEAAEADEPLDLLRTGDPETPVREWAARSLAILRGAPQTYPNSSGEPVLPDELYR